MNFPSHLLFQVCGNLLRRTCNESNPNRGPLKLSRVIFGLFKVLSRLWIEVSVFRFASSTSSPCIFLSVISIINGIRSGKAINSWLYVFSIFPPWTFSKRNEIYIFHQIVQCCLRSLFLHQALFQFGSCIVCSYNW